MKGHTSNLLRAVLSGAIALALTSAPALGAENDPAAVPRPNATTQPVSDGCQRNPAGLLTFTSPEWVYVYDYQSKYEPGVPRVAQGDVTNTDLATGDLPQSHNWYDFNTDVKVDPAYDYLLGGDPTVPKDATGAGNFADPVPILHVEWESGTLPPYAWAVAGDRVKLWGRWVWDCGHWQEGFTTNPSDPASTIVHNGDYFLPGTGQSLGPEGAIRGEQTEFHPLESVLVTRYDPTVPSVGETETDAFLSSQGTPAAADSRCSHLHPAPGPANSLTSFYGPDWTACINDPSQQRNPVNDRDYTVFIPAPPKPSAGAQLRVRIDDHHPAGAGPAEEITPVGQKGVQVTIPFAGFGTDSQQLAYGKSIFVGWDGSSQFVPAHVQVVLKKLTIHHSLDDPGPDTSTQVPPGEWNLYSSINDSWKLINDYAPQLGAVNSGDVLSLDHTYDVNVPAGQPLKVSVGGRECDLPKINPCPNTTEVAEDNDDPDTATDSYPSVESAVGTHVLKPPGSDPNWEMTYEVKLISPAGKANITPGPGCPLDVFAPRSRIIRRRAKALRHRIVLKGRARDTNCTGRRGRPSRVEVSIGLKVGKKRCRFLRGGGRLGAAQPCRRPSYLRAKGARRWKAAKRWPDKPGSYLIRSRATDRAGNVELRATRANRFRLVVAP